METDDTVRPSKGVVICLRDMGNGTSRLFFDDVKADRAANPINWSYESFFTFTPALSNGLVDAMKLSDAQLLDIGVAVVARLLALNGRASNF